MNLSELLTRKGAKYTQISQDIGINNQKRSLGLNYETLVGIPLTQKHILVKIATNTDNLKISAACVMTLNLLC